MTLTGSATTVLLLWAQGGADFTPTWTGDLLDAAIRIRNTSGSGDFKLDDVTVTDRGPHYLELVAGTWRPEVVP